ncbi:hypothetical protein A3762_03620 [Oleiphilus sp. HI0125]|uniref:uroporphyrinogen-III synthase n=2 Tax=Oleiphilus sp. HI0125 TaxID=1822266 RepID=UPI0007C3A8A1|nr:uroporphyrinogen-III synthase [Oleiphilus sp. HI0125]KZZ60073.1 hypothetical protein A3762_03620 [Oleiphilus sp. HI0125]
MIQQVLKGRKILVCRPEPSATELCTVLNSVGASSIALPCIQILPIEPSQTSKQYIFNLDQYGKVIVVSQFAAHRVLSLVDELWPQMPAEQTWYGIGRKTTSVLAESEAQLYDAQQDLNSEGLLDIPDLQNVKGERILVVKGKDGRSKLEQGLRARGAQIDHLDLYERLKPEYSDEQLQNALNDFVPDSIITLSLETLDNLHAYSQQTNYSAYNAKLVVPSQRVASHAQRLGFKEIAVSEQLKPINLIQALK